MDALPEGEFTNVEFNLHELASNVRRCCRGAHVGHRPQARRRIIVLATGGTKVV